MSKDYHDFYVNKSNSPKLHMYTLMLGQFFSFSGINFLVTCWWNSDCDEPINTSCLIMGIILVLITPVVCVDRRKENRSKDAVLAAMLMHAICAVVCAVIMHSGCIFILYALEVLVCLLCWFSSKSKFRHISK